MLAAELNSIPNQSIFDPASPATEAIVSLSVLVLVICGVIFVVVEGILLYSVWRFAHRDPPAAGQSHAEGPGDDDRYFEPPQVYGSQAIEIAWTIAPALVVVFLGLVFTRTLWQINASPPEPAADAAGLVVTVTGRQWWWEYTYERYNGRELRFTTANELHIPASDSAVPRPVHLILKSADVCHSFWVPRLAGKVDLLPGRINSLLLESQETGLFLGQCAEYCGTQHANMFIRVVVDEPAAFDDWLASQQEPPVDDPAAREGQEVFLAQSCVNCHRVRGTPADGDYGPDLTHLMSRQSLASGEIKNNASELERWVRDPQAIKPGCLMPAFGLSEREQALVVQYLQTLR